MQRNFKKLGALVATLLVASCSDRPTTPSAAPVATADATREGMVQDSAAGDVNVGPVAIDMSLVRVAQSGGVPAFYANPAGEYSINSGTDTEIYIQIWNSNPVVQNPRLIVDWGNGQRDNTSCGSCRLTARYNAEGRYTVRVTLDDRVSSTTTRTFVLNAKFSNNGTFTFSNSALIEIPANSTVASSGAATPYPASIKVGGLSGRVSKVTVTMKGYSHTYHDDMNILLVAPNGQAVKLMDDVGQNFNGNNADVTFADGAPGFPNADIGPGSFTFSPSVSGTTVLPPPAPATSGATTLSAFNGQSPNGTWQLFIFDDANGDIGQMAGGWSLTLTIVDATSSIDVVKAETAGVVRSSLWPNAHIFNYPFQKSDR